MTSQKDQKNSFIDDCLIIEEEKIEEGENSKILYEKAEKSICQIIKGKGSETGFFCKIKISNKSKEIDCLIANNNIITKDMLRNNENIEIKLNNKNIKISLNLYRIWTNKELDFTCIEIIKEDNIIEIINPFEIDENCYNSNDNIKVYDNKGIFFPSKGLKEKIELSKGIVSYIKIKKNKKIIYLIAI